MVASASVKSVIPESAAGGYPESRKNNNLLDTGSRPPQADLAGMTKSAKYDPGSQGRGF
jgi:hypothetical protein